MLRIHDSELNLSWLQVEVWDHLLLEHLSVRLVRLLRPLIQYPALLFKIIVLYVHHSDRTCRSIVVIIVYWGWAWWLVLADSCSTWKGSRTIRLIKHRWLVVIWYGSNLWHKVLSIASRVATLHLLSHLRSSSHHRPRVSTAKLSLSSIFVSWNRSPYLVRKFLSYYHLLLSHLSTHYFIWGILKLFLLFFLIFLIFKVIIFFIW